MIKKLILTETPLYEGFVKMPDGFEIEKNDLVKNITLSQYYTDIEYPFSKAWDKLKTYVCEFMYVEHKLKISPIKSFGNFYEKNEHSKNKLEIDFFNLNKNPDLVLLYGVEIDPNTCEVNIYYDTDIVKNKVYVNYLENNKFIIFPASKLYCINNKNNSFLNFIQTITFKIW